MQKRYARCGLALLAILFAAGCATGEPGEAVDTGDDAGETQIDMGTTTETDAGNGEVDAGTGEEDMGPPPVEPKPLQQTLSPTGGGDTIETGQHRMRLLIAPPTPVGTVETPKHKIKLGAGAAQHGQASE